MVDKFNEELLQYKGEIESGKPVADHQKVFDDFLAQKTTPKRGLQVSFNSEAVSQYTSNRRRMLFVQFIALILISAIRKEMRSSKLIEKYTVRELLQEMKTLTKVKYSGK